LDETYASYSSIYRIPQSTKPAYRSFLFLLIVLSLTALGLVSLYSASYDEALRLHLPASYYVSRQALFALAGALIFFSIQFLSMELIYSLIPLAFFGALVLMLLTLIGPFGVAKFGARRWLTLGPLPSFQPSEVLKVTLILFLARINASDSTIGSKTVVSLVAVALSALLVLAQRDYSSTVLVLFGSLVMFLLGHVAFRYIALFGVASAAIGLLFMLSESYRIKRLLSFFYPSADPQGINWQVQNGLRAISEGRFFGKGLGKGVYKLGIIPEVHSDFIFASYAEEMGLVGTVVLFALFAAFGFFGFYTAFANRKKDHAFAFYLCVGFTFMIVMQALVNIAVVSALLPPTGIVLPFFSQGGTNLLMVLTQSGLLYKALVSVEKQEVLYG
jgi:cell division protein FtsW